MKNLRWTAPVILAAFVGCASTSTPRAPPVDAGSDRDPCAGLGCAVGPPSVTLAIQDGAGAPVPSPFFSEGGKQLMFLCMSYGQDAGAGDAAAGDAGDAGPGQPCAKWRLVFSAGKHSITVDAQGYVSQTLDVELQGPVGCCGQGEQLEMTVTLHRP